MAEPHTLRRETVFRLPQCFRLRLGSLKSLQNLQPMERRRLADILLTNKPR
ncbi:hypothetical protein [Kingella oralis]|uniref:hypothetical protein n=1 Tax=Kingella oralis TaxID=505 RepID=UPI0034E59681